MRIRSALFALAMIPGALAFAVTPAEIEDTCTTYSDAGTPDDTSDDIVLCTQSYYLSCEHAVGGKVHDQAQHPVVPLVAEAPTTAFTAGGGCGYPQQNLLTNANQGTLSDFNFGGIVATNVDTLTVEVHDLGPHENLFQAANGSDVEVGMRLTIDGTSIFGTEPFETAAGDVLEVAAEIPIETEAVLSETGLSTSYTVTVTNIAEAFPELLTVLGDGSQPAWHNVLVTFQYPFTDLDGVFTGGPRDNVAPVWGATEVPASITLNGEVVGGTVDARAFAE